MKRVGHSNFVTRLHYAWSDPVFSAHDDDVCLGGDLKLHLKCSFRGGPPRGAPPAKHPVLNIMLAPFRRSARFYAAEILLGIESAFWDNHRDLKPSNCLVDCRHIRIADLGLAYVFEKCTPGARIPKNDGPAWE